MWFADVHAQHAHLAQLLACQHPVFLPFAGLKAIYLSGWQVAADANSALQTYPDQSLYPVDSVPRVVSYASIVASPAVAMSELRACPMVHMYC